MSDQQTFFSKIGNFFRRSNGDLPLSDSTAIEPRSTFLRPWARRDAAIEHLQDGFTTLTDLMSAIRQTLENQSKQQDELVGYLAHLPEALRAIPESSRIHGETLRAIHTQLEQQNIQQERLGEILEKMSQSDGAQRESIDEIRERVETIRQTDEAISSNLSNLGSALQSVTRNSTAGTQVLEQMRDRISSRDDQLEQILHRQGTRFTAMLAVAIFLSISALAAVCVIGYMLMNQKPV
ncbi:MAG TPA: hypothetical protein VHD56_03085 [Tepidisphaeraceae bacterium]|nr:hypothetical protein [Tepidisphaeraceae bacterium]